MITSKNTYPTLAFPNAILNQKNDNPNNDQILGLLIKWE